MRTRNFYPLGSVALTVLLMTNNALAQSPQELLTQLQQLRAEMQVMKQELDALKQVGAEIGRAHV